MPENEPRLLIVDDEAAQVQALCDTLGPCGYRPVGFTSPIEALAALRQTAFDLLLTDMRMPDMDGIELLRAALEIDADLVGVMMTGEGTIATAIEAMKSGALDYILKPFKLSAMRPVLARASAVRRLRLEKKALEHSVRDRTERLQQANRELDAFARSVSHDLRSPLQAVIGFSDLLLTTAAPPLEGRSRAFAAHIGQAGRQMNRLIEDLLRLSRVSFCELEMRPVDLSAMAGQLVEQLRKEAPGRKVDVHIEPGIVVQGDEGLLRIALGNLLGNAWKYSSKVVDASIAFGTCRELVDDGPGYEVRDNGAGFDMAAAGHLFEPFQRLHSEDEFAGTGVGLSIVQRIVHRHGGRIWAQAAVGEGACFAFTLQPSMAQRAP